MWTCDFMLDTLIPSCLQPGGLEKRASLPLIYLLTCDGVSYRLVHPPSLSRTAIPGAAVSDANQSFYSEVDNLWLARRVTDSISGMFLLSCPMFGAVISLHQATCSAADTLISRVAIYPTSN